MNALIVTALSGMSFFVGYLISIISKKKDKMMIYSIGFSFSVILGLVFIDLIPECIELFDNYLYLIIFIILGFGILKLFDYLIPNHHHSHEDSHIEHIGIIFFVAIFLHNTIEGLAIYICALNDIKSAILMTLGVALHNIPLGIQISSLIKNKMKKLILIILLCLSSVFGLILINLFNLVITDNLLAFLIAITLGMLIYITFFELLCEVKEHISNKSNIFGLLSGIIVIILMLIM